MKTLSRSAGLVIAGLWVVACANASPELTAEVGEPTATRAQLATAISTLVVVSPDPSSLASTPSATSSPTSTSDAILENALTAIPGPLVQITNRGGIDDLARYRWLVPGGPEAIEPMKTVILDFLRIIAQKTNSDPISDLKAQLSTVMTTPDGFQRLSGECDLDDVVWYYSKVEQPTFGPAYSRWIDALDLKSGVWAGLSTTVTTGATYETTEITYDAVQGFALSGLYVSFDTGTIKSEILTTGEVVASSDAIGGTTKLKFVDGSWKVALTEVGCDSSAR